MLRIAVAVFGVMRILVCITLGGMISTYIGLIVLSAFAIALHVILQPLSSMPTNHDQYWEENAR